MKSLALASTLLAVLPLAALAGEGDPRTETVITFGYENAKTDEPLVVQNGVPSSSFFYRADSVTRSLGVAATRWLGPVPDDGSTPFALQPYVARTSTLSARARLSLVSRDSFGSSETFSTRFESRFTGDRNVPSVGLSGEWYFHPSTSVSASVESRRLRETAVATSEELVSQRREVLSVLTRTSVLGASLGVTRWLGATAAVTVGGFVEDSDLERTDESSLLPAPYETSVLDLHGRTWGARASGRVLLLRRRLVLDAAGTYFTTKSELNQDVPAPAPVDEGYSVGREISGGVSWYPLRALGLTAGLLYTTRSDSGGLTDRRPTGYSKKVRVSGAVSWFVSPRRAALLTFSRTTGNTLNPPGGPTYQELRDVTDVVELSALLRF